jgi:NADPH-dependent 2,4-dienoyl-CoA reductase/sulfur reductase-like enzyme
MLSGFHNVHVLRTFDDAVQLRAALGHGRRLAILGAGFLGLEAAATARALGTEVDVIDLAPVPLARVLPPEVGGWFRDLHAREGVRMHLGDPVASVQTDGGLIHGLQLASEAQIACDAVLAAVGVRPATGWLDATGPLATDTQGRTVLPGVFAAGDAAAWPDPTTGEPRWGQQWEIAARQGATVARAMLGAQVPEPTLPAFWTDQYGVRVQQLGTHEAADETILDGDPTECDFAVTWRRDCRVIGALVANRPREFAALRRLIHPDRPRGGDHELQGADR